MNFESKLIKFIISLGGLISYEVLPPEQYEINNTQDETTIKIYNENSSNNDNLQISSSC